MKCLSVKQPFAEFLISGKKTIELRRWNTNFRGDLLIYTSKKIDTEALERNQIDPNNLVRGAIVEMVNLYGVKSYESKNSFIKDKRRGL